MFCHLYGFWPFNHFQNVIQVWTKSCTLMAEHIGTLFLGKCSLTNWVIWISPNFLKVLETEAWISTFHPQLRFNINRVHAVYSKFNILDSKALTNFFVDNWYTEILYPKWQTDLFQSNWEPVSTKTIWFYTC